MRGHYLFLRAESCDQSGRNLARQACLVLAAPAAQTGRKQVIISLSNRCCNNFLLYVFLFTPTGQADNFSYTIQASAYHTRCYQQSMLRGVVLLVSMRPFDSRLESDSQWSSRVFLTRTRNNESDHVVGPTVACESPSSLAKPKQNQPNQTRSIKQNTYIYIYVTVPFQTFSPLRPTYLAAICSRTFLCSALCRHSGTLP